MASVGQTKKKRSQCEWCGKPSTTQCSRCHHFVICSPESMKSAWAIHARVCRRVSMKPYVTSPESSMYGVGELDFEAAHRQLKGEYCLGEDGKPMMREPYESEEDRPDYFLMLPEGARKLVVEYFDVKSLCRADQVMGNVYTSMAWLEALKDTFSVALSRWPRYSDKDGYAGLRWSMNRRMRVGASIRFRKIRSAPWCDVSDKASVFCELCQKKKAAEVACYLVGQGWIDPNSSFKPEEGRDLPILIVACKFGRPPVVKALLQAGANVDKTTNNGDTALMTASQDGHSAIVKALLQAGADTGKADNKDALILACQGGHVATVEALIQAGADIDKAADNSYTPLMAASSRGNTAIMEALIQAGADVDKTTDDGWTPLILVSGKGQGALTEVLLQAGADVDKADDSGKTALILVSQEGHTAIAEALIKAGADIDKAKNDGSTALMMASFYGHGATMEAILQAGADVDKAENEGWTALTWAIHGGRAAAVEALLQAGADIDKADDSGKTALMRARHAGHSAIVKLLLDAGATK